MSSDKVNGKYRPEPMDSKPTDDFVLKTVELFGQKADQMTAKQFFKGDQTKEFYLGMSSGLMAALDILRTFPATELQAVFSEIQIMAIINASKKSSSIITFN